MNSLPLDQPILQEIMPPFLEHPSDIRVQEVKGSKLSLMCISYKKQQLDSFFSCLIYIYDTKTGHLIVLISLLSNLYIDYTEFHFYTEMHSDY